MEAILCKPLVVVCSELVNTRGCMYVESLSRLAVHCCENCTKLEVGDKSTSLVFFCAARNHMPAVCSLLNDLTKLILGMVPKKNLRNKWGKDPYRPTLFSKEKVFRIPISVL